ncbi:DUF4838 domain-containing protein [Kaistella palustris]|uniref:DUF4838 domain-containing protein n=1 Tax=Kaistella palustris TaxID=493376 RepID=UPI00040E418C|nr:DUF4838 domain-containing protein [Kaistella palustris]
MRAFQLIIFVFLMGISSRFSAQELILAEHKKSAYQILLSENPTSAERKGADVLKHYFFRVTKISLPVNQTKAADRDYIQIKQLNASDPAKTENFSIKNEGQHITITGNSEKSLLKGVYEFISRYLQCRKWAPNEPAECPPLPILKIPVPIDVEESASFVYREVYSTAEKDAEYMDWYGLQSLDDLWGIWGHSFSNLVPSSLVGAHPEFFSLTDGKRRPDQLCLSNGEVFDLTVKSLEEHFKENPTAKYWSVSPNDNNNFCECSICRKTDDEEGGPQGSLLRFVNRIAARFPDKSFTTLAYGATAAPPLKTKPRANVIIFLSTINSFKNKPVETEVSAAQFRQNLEGWRAITPHIFIWDYYTQFTNYLAPFPDVFNAGPNMKYYRENGVRGVFAQLGGGNFVDHSDLKTYIISKKFWKANLDDGLLADEFLSGYYGKAAPLIKKHLTELQAAVEASGRRLDIYGNPISEYQTYLSPERLDSVDRLLDEAEKITDQKNIRRRIRKLRLSFDYTRLQQARFFGIEKYGIFTPDRTGKMKVRKELRQQVRNFVRSAESQGINLLSEDGETLSEYRKEWQEILRKGLPVNNALSAEVTLNTPFVPEYPAKGNVTLTDGMYGFTDFSYNWLLFEDGFSAELKLTAPQPVKTVKLDFLEDQRHWIFLPKSVKLEVSADGITYREVAENTIFTTKEQLQARTYQAQFLVGESIKYLKVTAEKLPAMPAWRKSKNRNPLMAIAEIWVQ